VAKKPTPKTQITEAQKAFEETFDEYLTPIAEDIIAQIMRSARKLTPSQRLNAIKDVTPKGVQEYKSVLLELMAACAQDAIALARKEVPNAKNVKLDEFSKLPPALQKKLKARNDLLVGKQIGDLQKTIEFAYTANEDTTDSYDTLEADLNDSALGFLNGTSVTAGAQLTAATVISQAREAFFFDDDTLQEIDAFEFVNGDPVTPICQDLAGTIFSKDDPDLFRYTPPLHWNCKSYIRPILVGNLGKREVTKLKPSSSKLEETIQFSEKSCSCCSLLDVSDPDAQNG